MEYSPLTREEIKRVVEGRGNASRVPSLMHFWIYPNSFGEREQAVREILDRYPMDAQFITLRIPGVFDAPADDPSYRWSYKDREVAMNAYDSDRAVEDWDEELDKLLDDFPSPDYPGLIPECPPDDGRYRIGTWFYFFFERLWSIRGMENALTDFFLYPDAVHVLFRKLTDFYKRMITRAKEELKLDAIMTSDDLGSQTSTLFSPKVFEEFFMPYYREVIDHIHSLGMHFWLHTCGNVKAIMPRFVELGIDVQHPIQKYTMDERKIAREFGGKISIWAGFDVQRTIPYGTPEDVRREARFLIDTWARPDGRFLFTLGNGATADTPIPSLEALFDELFTYGTKKIREINQEYRSGG